MKVPITAHKVSHKVTKQLKARAHARAAKKTAKKSLHQQHADSLFQLAHPQDAKRQKKIRRTLTHVVLPIGLIVASASFAIGAEVVHKASTRSIPVVPPNSICRVFSANELDPQDARIGVTLNDSEFPTKFTYNFGGMTPNYLIAQDGNGNLYSLSDLKNNSLTSAMASFGYMKICVSDPGPVMPPFTSRSALVDQQYRDFMGRNATASEQAFWANSGYDARQIVTWFVDNDADKRGPLVRLYKAYYKRWPDAGGYDYWIRKMKNGTSLTKVSDSFASANEFKTKYGTVSNEQFMQLVYNNVLDRAPDPSGYNYWLRRLNAKTISRGGVMLQFSESSEFKRKYGLDCELQGVSLRMLRRPATTAELTSWNPDEDATTLAYPIIFQSQEYANRIVK